MCSICVFLIFGKNVLDKSREFHGWHARVVSTSENSSKGKALRRKNAGAKAAVEAG